MSGTLLGSILNGKALFRQCGAQAELPAPEAPRSIAGRRPRVSLVVTPIGPNLKQFQAYHTSVLVDDEEYCFGTRGIAIGTGTESHSICERSAGETRIFNLGFAREGADNLYEVLRPHFGGGSYDLLKKNCNSFTDCALFYLLRQRLDRQYRYLEKLAGCADACTSFVQKLSGGQYTPNPNAVGFDSLEVVRELNQGYFLFGLPLCM